MHVEINCVFIKNMCFILNRMARVRGGGGRGGGRGGLVPYRGTLLTRNETHASNRAYDDVSVFLIN